MAKNILALFLASCFIGAVLTFRPQNANQLGKNWCLAQLGAPADKLQAFIDYSCGVNDCTAIQPGAPCFEPNNVVGHASFALNQEYRRTGVCHLDIGAMATIDPSSGSCQYP